MLAAITRTPLGTPLGASALGAANLNNPRGPAALRELQQGEGPSSMGHRTGKRRRGCQPLALAGCPLAHRSSAAPASLSSHQWLVMGTHPRVTITSMGTMVCVRCCCSWRGPHWPVTALDSWWCGLMLLLPTDAVCRWWLPASHPTDTCWAP